MGKRLTSAQKKEIVERYAQFQGAAEIVQALALDGIPRRTVRSYNFDNEANRKRSSPKWIGLFDAARERYLADRDSVGSSHKVHRLHILDAIIRRSMATGDHAGAIRALEAARKETEDRGGVNIELSRLILEAEAK